MKFYRRCNAQVVCFCRAAADKVWVLIQLRSKTANKMAYHLAAIGGKREDHLDKNSRETALREFCEETGAVMSRNTILTKFD